MFKHKYLFEQRKKESTDIKLRYPDRVPVICEKSPNGNDSIPVIDKTKYLVPSDLTFGQMIFVIRQRLKLNPEVAIFLFVNNSLPPSCLLMSEVYDKYKETDGFLYITYAGENTFGALKDTE